MATVINNPPGPERVEVVDSGAGIVLGVIVALVLIVLFFVYGLPALRDNQPPTPDNDTNINIEIPNPLPDSNSNPSGGTNNP